MARDEPSFIVALRSCIDARGGGLRQLWGALRRPLGLQPCINRHFETSGCGPLPQPDVSANRDAPQQFDKFDRAATDCIGCLHMLVWQLSYQIAPPSTRTDSSPNRKLSAMKTIDLLKQKLATLESVRKTPEEIADDEEIIAGLGLDSLDYASILIECEGVLGVSVAEDEIDWRIVRTVAQLAAVLEQGRKVA